MAQKILKINGKTFTLKKSLKDFEDFKKKFLYVYEPMMKKDFEMIKQKLSENNIEFLNSLFSDTIGLTEKDKDSDYDKFFNKMLKKWNVDDPSELSKEDKKKFFNEVDKLWKAKKETD